MFKRRDIVRGGVKNGEFSREGWRLVRKGGRVKFDGFWHQDKSLIPFEGLDVWCESDDIWGGTSIHVFEQQYGKFICVARGVE